MGPRLGRSRLRRKRDRDVFMGRARRRIYGVRQTPTGRIILFHGFVPWWIRQMLQDRNQ